jgi:UDP-N-acetylglucosamine acyltransferase
MGLEKVNYIHPTAIVEQDVTLGNNNYIGPYCYITGNTIIGDNNRFEAYCSIGTPAECIGYFDSFEKSTIIGNNNIFREFVTINGGTTKKTILGNNIIMLRGSHVGHDAIIEDKVNLSCNSIIGGYSYIMEGVNFGLGAICHQLLKIGAYSMIGMGTIITKTTEIKPGGVYMGVPARFVKENSFGFEKNNISRKKLELLIERYNNLKISR